jgi:hypothetical protein
MVDAALAEVAFEGTRRDPKLNGLLLLCRSISNFKGALTMARDNQALECLTLVRSCFENLIYVGDLCERGAESVHAKLGDSASRLRDLGELELKTLASGDPESGTLTRARNKRLSAEFPNAKKVQLGKIARGVMEEAYYIFRMLSGDAAHPSVTALLRHFSEATVRERNKERTKTRLKVTVVPGFKPKERLATLDWACAALLGVCIRVEQILEGTSQSDAAIALCKRFEREIPAALRSHP